jgi:hypothetical protein
MILIRGDYVHMHNSDSFYWALFFLSIGIVLGLLVCEPLLDKYRSWKLKRAFRIREEASKIGKM